MTMDAAQAKRVNVLEPPNRWSALKLGDFDASEGDGVRGEWVGDLPGVVRPMFEWDVTEDGAV